MNEIGKGLSEIFVRVLLVVLHECVDEVCCTAVSEAGVVNRADFDEVLCRKTESQPSACSCK